MFTVVDDDGDNNNSPSLSTLLLDEGLLEEKDDGDGDVYALSDDDGDDAPLLLLLLGEGLEVLLVSETSSTVIEPLHPELGGIFPPLAVFVFKILHVLLPCFRNLH